MMTNRDHVDFLTHIRPPSGYKLEYCVGTSFSLEIPCLIQLALTASHKASTDDVTVFEALGALEDFQNRTVVFVQNCNIKELPRSALNPGKNQRHRLFLLIDQMIATVALRSPYQSFHPKVWFLRYEPVGKGDPIFKLVVMSRNISSAKNWDVSVSLFGVPGNGAGRNASIIEFVQSLRSESSIRKGSHNDKILFRAIKDLSQIQFETPKGTQESTFEFQWFGKKGFSLDPSKYERLIVISPFVAATELKRMSEATEVILITAPNQLAPLIQVRDQISRCFKFGMDEFELHAKMYIGLKKRGGSDIFIGSANCTVQGLSGVNAEAMIRMEAGSEWFRRFEEGFVFENKKQELLHPWLQNVDWKEIEALPVEPDATKDETILEHAKCQISTLDIELNIDRSTKKLTLTLKGVEANRLHSSVEGTILIAGSQKSFNLRTAVKGPVSLTWDEQALPSQFLLIELRKGRSVEVFCTVARSNVSRSSRLRSALGEFITDSDSFFEYLTALIQDFGLGMGSLNFQATNSKKSIKSSSKRGSSKVGMAALEALLVAVARDATIVARVNDAMSALYEKKDLKGTENLDDFRAVFNDVAEASQAVEKRYGKKIISTA